MTSRLAHTDLLLALERSTAKLAEVVGERDASRRDAATWEADSDAMLARAQKAESDLARARDCGHVCSIVGEQCQACLRRMFHREVERRDKDESDLAAARARIAELEGERANLMPRDYTSDWFYDYRALREHQAGKLRGERDAAMGHMDAAAKRADSLEARLAGARGALEYVGHHLKHGGLYGPLIWINEAKRLVREALEQGQAMKPAAEIAQELWRELSRPCISQDFTLPGPIEAIAAVITQARRDGAEEMKTRAAEEAEAVARTASTHAAMVTSEEIGYRIRHLPLEESEAGS